MAAEQFYPIGVPGTAWGPEERAAWASTRTKVERSYADEVLKKLEDPSIKDVFDVEQYGALSYDKDRYPLFVVKTKDWDAARPSVLVTGGVHGYETSGVQGALLFLQTRAAEYSTTHGFNIAVCPCVSPWGYERIQRWNANAEDPNRGFTGPDSTREECAGVWGVVESLGGKDAFLVHVDLHETTDTDESEFRPAKAARDGEKYEPDGIPDGFYLVGNSVLPQEEWHKAIIAEVKKVTHIAPPDAQGNIIGAPVQHEGVIVYPTKDLFLCSSVTNAPFATTTEVYPDSPKADDDQCNRAQVASVTGALDFLLANKALLETKKD